MRTDAAKVQRQIDEAGSVRFDGSGRPKKVTVLHRVRRLLRRPGKRRP